MSSQGQYKVMYFQLRGRGELIRWIMAASGVKWEDCRIDSKDWPNLKPTLPGQTLPVVITPEGQTLTQSLAIARYLAGKFGLIPNDSFQSYRCDVIIDTMFVDMLQHLSKVAPMQPPEVQQQGADNWNSNVAPQLFKTMSKWVADSRSGYLAGDRLSWADLGVASFIDSLRRMDPIRSSLDAYPDLLQFAERIQQSEKISNYLKSRPDSIM